MSKQHNISVVIPTLEGDPLTLSSVPESVETIVIGEGNRAEARNLGVERASGEIIVFCDDDIRFDEEFFWESVNRVEQGTILGLADFDFGLLLTRFLVVTRRDFEVIGGFDEEFNHMEDTEFCLRARSHNIDLVLIPREEVYHEDHESVGQSHWPTLKNTIKISLRYPRSAPNILRGLLR